MSWGSSNGSIHTTTTTLDPLKLRKHNQACEIWANLEVDTPLPFLLFPTTQS